MPFRLNKSRWLPITLLLAIVMATCVLDAIGIAKQQGPAGSASRIAPVAPVAPSKLEPAKPVEYDKLARVSEVRPLESSAKAQVKIASETAAAVTRGDESVAAGMTDDELAKSYKSIEVTATGYYAGVESTGKHPGHPEYGITFSGLKVMRDRNALSTIAADLSIFPLGTILWIPGYGYGLVADTGSAIKGHKIDLYFETKDQVYDLWGKKTLDVYIVEQGTGSITQEMFQQKVDTYKS